MSPASHIIHITCCKTGAPNAAIWCLLSHCHLPTFQLSLPTLQYSSERTPQGAETLVPGLKAMIDHIADLGAEVMVLGMPHRGRLNVLGNVVRKPMAQIFHEFGGAPHGDSEGFITGDVKYHLGERR